MLTTQAALNANKALDPEMPKVTDGIVTVEVPGKANLEIQQYIIANTKDGAGYIPGASPYSMSNMALNSPTVTNGSPVAMPTAACANMDLACRSGVGVQQNVPIGQQSRETIADGASSLSRQVGGLAAMATAIGSQAGPYAKPAQALAVGATVVGIGADALEQIARPNNGQTLVNSISTTLSEHINKRLSGAAPITNKILEIGKSSPVGQTIVKRLNDLTNSGTK